MLRRASALLAFVMLLVPLGASAQAQAALSAAVSVVDDAGAPIHGFPCHVLEIQAQAIAVVQSTRAVDSGDAACTASFSGLPPLIPASLSVLVHPNLHCPAHPRPSPVRGPSVAPGGSANVTFTIAFSCDTATLFRSLRARGVSLATPAPASPVPPFARRVVLPLGHATKPLKVPVKLSPVQTRTLEWHHYDRGGTCADDQAYDGLTGNVTINWEMMFRETTRPGSIGVGFNDGTWAGVLCGATLASVWEGWALFDLSPLANSGGYFGSARLYTSNAVIGYSNASYTSGRSCLHSVVAATADLPSGQRTGTDRASLLAMPGHQAAPAGTPAAGAVSAGASEFSTITDVTPIVRAWLRGAPNHGFLFVEPPVPSTFPHDNEYCYQALRSVSLIVTPYRP